MDEWDGGDGTDLAGMAGTTPVPATKQQQLEAVRRWLTDPNESVMVGDLQRDDHPWEDDHILCCTVTFCGVAVEWWWCGEDAYAAAKYANESPTARSDLAALVTSGLEPRLVDEIEQEGEDDDA